MQRRCNGGATEVQRRCNGGATEVQRRCNGNATEMQRRRNVGATVSGAVRTSQDWAKSAQPLSLREMLPPSAPEADRQRQGHIVVFMRMNLSLTFNTWLRPRPSETPQPVGGSYYLERKEAAHRVANTPIIEEKCADCRRRLRFFRFLNPPCTADDG